MHSARLSAQPVEIDNSAGYVGSTRPQVQLAGGASLRLEVLREVPEDVNLRRHWNALVLRVEQPQVFYTWEWALAVQRAYHATLRPIVFLAYDTSNALCAIAALATDESGGHASFLCATTGDYCDFLSAPEHRDVFVRAVLLELKQREIREIVLTNLPADSPTVAAIETNSRACRFLSFARPAYMCAQVSLAQLPRRGENDPVLPRKKMLRRFLNAMGREQPVRLEHARSWSEVEPQLDHFMESHVARFLANGRISNIASCERRIFLQELSRLLSEAGWLALTRMTSGDRVLAWNYGFQFEGTRFWYQPTFDMRLEKYSPGFCLLAKIVEEAAADPTIHTVDLGLGAEEYKDRFANQLRPTLWMSLTSSLPHHVRTVARYRITEAIRKKPRLEKAARSFLERYQTFRQRMRDSGVFRTGLWVCHRAVRAIAARDEVLFYEFFQPEPDMSVAKDVPLAAIDEDLLANAVMQHSDEGTLSYLVRCANRLRSGDNSAGFAMSDRNGTFGHFTWARPFEDFYFSELQSSVPSPAPGSVILFDSWTPASQRGYGFYAQTLASVVCRLRGEGKRVWGFSASTNASSIRGLEKAGWRPSFIARRYRFLGWRRIIQRSIAVARPSRVEGQPR